jgi:hypothetical protein
VRRPIKDTISAYGSSEVEVMVDGVIEGMVEGRAEGASSLLFRYVSLMLYIKQQ